MFRFGNNEHDNGPRTEFAGMLTLEHSAVQY